jgi:hypothetical protein
MSSLNPEKLPLKIVKEEFHQHNQYVIDNAVLYHSKKYKEQLTTYDEYYTHMLHFSDMLAYALQ